MTALGAAMARELADHLSIVCRRIGADPARAELIKYTINAVYRLPPYVIRMSRGGHAAGRTVATATALARAGLPTVRLADDAGPQPIRAGAWTATVWRYVPTTGRVPEPVDLAPPVRAIHGVSTVDADLPHWAPVAKARRRLDAAAALTGRPSQTLRDWSRAELNRDVDALLTGLRDRCDALERDLAAVRWHLPPGLIHGDAHTGNLLVTDTGVVICDLDSTGTGPREWDLTPSAHGATRFGRSRAAYDAFATAYGFDVVTWPGWPTMRAVRDLQCATSTLGTFDGRPDVARQLAHRLRTLDDETVVWARHV
jgi:hypothetical protein